MTTLISRNIVKKHLLKEIQSGNLQIGNTINLAAFSRKLNVSVTPIREALAQLEESKIVKAVPKRGFIINTLSIKEATDLYNTVAELEAVALDTAIFTTAMKVELKETLVKLQQSHTAKRKLRLRMHFHEIIVAACDNNILKTILEKLKARIFFYEQLYFDNPEFYETIDNQNEGILRAIEEDNLPTAALILKMNWMTVLDYLKSN